MVWIVFSYRHSWTNEGNYYKWEFQSIWQHFNRIRNKFKTNKIIWSLWISRSYNYKWNLRKLVDSNEAAAPCEPADPSEAAVPFEPVDPSEAAAPCGPAESSEAAVSFEPAENLFNSSS